MDADFSHDPDDIPRLLAALEPAAGVPVDAVIGSRKVAGGRVVGEGPPREVLADDELLSRAGLEPPLAARLARELGLGVVTDEELARALRPPGNRDEICPRRRQKNSAPRRAWRCSC